MGRRVRRTLDRRLSAPAVASYIGMDAMNRRGRSKTGTPTTSCLSRSSSIPSSAVHSPVFVHTYMTLNMEGQHFPPRCFAISEVPSISLFYQVKDRTIKGRVSLEHKNITLPLSIFDLSRWQSRDPALQKPEDALPRPPTSLPHPLGSSLRRGYHPRWPLLA